MSSKSCSAKSVIDSRSPPKRQIFGCASRAPPGRPSRKQGWNCSGLGALHSTPWRKERGCRMPNAKCRRLRGGESSDCHSIPECPMALLRALCDRSHRPTPFLPRLANHSINPAVLPRHSIASFCGRQLIHITDSPVHAWTRDVRRAWMVMTSCSSAHIHISPIDRRIFERLSSLPPSNVRPPLPPAHPRFRNPASRFQLPLLSFTLVRDGIRRHSSFLRPLSLLCDHAHVALSEPCQSPGRLIN